MEMSVFNRSGDYSADVFDMDQEPERFIRALAGYVLISDEELGMDTFIEREGQRWFVTVTDVTGKEQRLELEKFSIAIQRAIACRGTCCYHGSEACGQVLVDIQQAATRSRASQESARERRERRCTSTRSPTDNQCRRGARRLDISQETKAPAEAACPQSRGRRPGRGEELFRGWS